MSSNTPLPTKRSLAQELQRVARTLTEDAQNAALRKCQELGFDTNKGLISLEETLINLTEARDVLLDAVETGKLTQLPLRLQYSLYELTQRIAQQLTSLVNGTDEIVNLVNSVEDITAAIWQYSLRNLSGEVLGLQTKLNQVKAMETQIRQASREAKEFFGLHETAKSSLSQISVLASEATNLKNSLAGTAGEMEAILSKASESSQRITGIAAQVGQHETTATQQLATTKQAAADTETAAKKAKELQGEMEADGAALRKVLVQFQDALTSTQAAAATELADSKKKTEELFTTTEASISAMATKLSDAIATQGGNVENAVKNAITSFNGIETETSGKVSKLITDTSSQVTQLETNHEARFTAQLQEFMLNANNQQKTLDTQLAGKLTEFAETSKKQLTDQASTFNTQLTEWCGQAEQVAQEREAQYKQLVATLDELEGRIRESIERATGYSLFQSFQKRQLDIARAKRFWGYALGCVVGLSLILSGVFIYELRYVQVYNAAFYLKLSISVPLIYAIAFCNLQYSRERRLEEEYAFKSNISVSLDPYQKLVEKLVDKTKPDELSKYTAFVIESVNRVYTSPTGQIFEVPGDRNSAEKLIKALGEFIEPVIKGLKR